MDRHAAEPRVDELPGERASEWAEYYGAVAAPSTHLYDFVWDHTAEAEGPFCRDVDGNVLLDFTSHVAASPLGYNNPKLMEKLAAFDLVDPTKIAGQDFHVGGGGLPEEGLPGPGELMHTLVDITGDSDMDTVFLSNSGAEAIENAIKICYDHRDGAKYGITFDGAFHGRTLGALSLNRSKAVHRRDFPEIPGISSFPYCEDRSCDPGTCSCGFFAGGVSRLRRMLDPERGWVNADEVAYLEDGDTAVVGARLQDSGVAETGAVTVFSRRAGTWTRTDRLVPEGSDRNDGFGSAVALEGETAVVGAPTETTEAGTSAGSASVYARRGGSWDSDGRLSDPDARSDRHFGSAVAVAGDRAVVGSARTSRTW